MSKDSARQFENDYRKHWDGYAKEEQKALAAILGKPDITLDEFIKWGEGEAKGLLVPRLPKLKPAVGLDYGCGAGRLLRPMTKSLDTAIGADVSPKMLEHANRICEAKAKLLLVPGDGRIPGVQDGSVTLVWSILVLQHMEQVDAFLALTEFFRVLRPGGHAIITLPNLAAKPYADIMQRSTSRTTFGADRLRFYTLDMAVHMMSGAGFFVRPISASGNEIILDGVKDAV